MNENFFWKPPLRPDELMHHGVLGQKWGIRRYQNKDGTLTAKGKKHKEAMASAFDYNARVRNQASEFTKSNYDFAKKGMRGTPSKDELYTLGKIYLNNRKMAIYNETMSKAVKSDQLKVGEDYVKKSLKIGDNFYDKQFTDKGKSKINELSIKADKTFKKENSKMIKEVESYKRSNISKDLEKARQKYNDDPTMKNYQKLQKLQQLSDLDKD